MPNLPTEIWLKIFSHADPTTTCRTEQVCRAWKGLHREESLTVWLPKVRGLTDDGAEPYLLKGETFKDVYRIHWGWERFRDWRVDPVREVGMVGEEDVAGLVRGSEVVGVAAWGQGVHTCRSRGFGPHDVEYCVETAGNTTFLHKRSCWDLTYALTSPHDDETMSARLPPASRSLLIHRANVESDFVFGCVTSYLVESSRTDLMGVVVRKQSRINPIDFSIYLFDSRTLRQCHEIRLPIGLYVAKDVAILHGNLLAVLVFNVDIRLYRIDREMPVSSGPIRVFQIPNRHYLGDGPFALSARHIVWQEEILRIRRMIVVRKLHDPKDNGVIIPLTTRDAFGFARLHLTRTQILAVAATNIHVFSLQSYTCQNIILLNLKPAHCDRVRLSECGTFMTMLSVEYTASRGFGWDPLASELDVVANKAYGWEQGRWGLDFRDGVHTTRQGGIEVRNGFFLWYRPKEQTDNAQRDLECVWVRLKPSIV